MMSGGMVERLKVSHHPLVSHPLLYLGDVDPYSRYFLLREYATATRDINLGGFTLCFLIILRQPKMAHGARLTIGRGGRVVHPVLGGLLRGGLGDGVVVTAGKLLSPRGCCHRWVILTFR
jgi:hypothetical protein